MTDELLVPFGAIAPTPLVDEDVNFGTAGFADSTVTCDGTPEAPTAPPGKVCIYAHSSDGTDRANSIGFAAQLLPDRGFVIAITPEGVADADAYLFATWAYTAP